MNLIIIGNGMYVSGRGTDGFGTIMPALCEYIRSNGEITEVHLVGTIRDHSLEAKVKSQELMDQTGVSFKLNVYPEKVEKDTNAYKAVLENIDGPGCAIVAVPDHLHHEITLWCLKAGLHTMVVKPLTPTLKKARELTDFAKNKGLYGAVEFHKRWDKQNLMLRDIFQSGRLGDPLYTWTEYSQRKSIPSKIFKNWVERSNILQYLGVHYIDIIRFVTGAVPVRAMAVGQKNWLVSQGLNVHDALQCMVEWEMPNGTRFNQTLLNNWIDPESTSAMSDQKLKLVGTKGRFEADQKERGINLVIDGENIGTPNPDFCQPYGTTDNKTRWQGYGIESIVTFLKDVDNIINSGKTPSSLEGKRPTFMEAMISTAVIETASISLADNGTWKLVSLP